MKKSSFHTRKLGEITVFYAVEVNKQLGELIIEIIRNDNIKRENLTRKEVHFNKDRIKVFVMNLIADIWKV